MDTKFSENTGSQLTEQAVNGFAAQLQGELIRPGNAYYGIRPIH